MDRKKVMKYLRDIGADIPANEEVFLAGLHKARIEITTMPESAKEESRKWLTAHGFRPGIMD